MKEQLSPEKILNLSRTFMQSRILLSGAELDLFTLLGPQPLTAEEAADRTGYHLRPLTYLLDVLAALEFLDKKEGRYQTQPSLLPFLSSDSENSILPMLLHAAHIWESWSTLTEVVRETGGPDRAPGTAWKDETAQKAFIGAMHVVGSRHAGSVAASVGAGGARSLIDVGGGSGTYTIAFLRANPEMKAAIFDLPQVTEMARARLSEAGLLERTTLVSGDLYADDLPGGHDLAFVSAIIHMNSPEQNLALYRKVFAALESGGRIVIRDHVMKPDKTEPLAGAVFAINMLVGTPGGGTYTFEEIRAPLAEAGFVRIRQLQDSDQMLGLVEGFKP